MNALIWTITLSSCGSTSSLRGTKESAQLPGFSIYNYVIVNYFKDSRSKSSDDPHIISEGKKCADIVASSIKSTKLFDKVERNTDFTDTAIVIEGKITQYSEGNAVTRTLIGFGAGRSYFDAEINIKDNETKQLLGSMDVNKRSCALGGAIAGTQDVNSHMNSAASKIADECAIAKNNGMDLPHIQNEKQMLIF